MDLSRKPAVLGLVVLCFALSANPARAELAKWDQKRVTEIAQQLAKACNAWSSALREQPGGQIGSGFASDEYALVQTARVLQEQSEALAAHLAHGKGHDETRNLYRSLKEIVDDTQVEVQRAGLDEPTLDAWAEVADLVRQIAPYYDPKAPEE